MAAVCPGGDRCWNAGERKIVPNDAIRDVAIRDVIADTCELELLGSFGSALTTQGTVVSAYPRKTTGFSAYDQEIVHTMRSQWRCRSFIKNGVPEPVCTTVSIHDTQRPPRRIRGLAPRRPR